MVQTLQNALSPHPRIDQRTDSAGSKHSKGQSDEFQRWPHHQDQTMPWADPQIDQARSDLIGLSIQLGKRQMSPRNSTTRIPCLRKHNRALMRHFLSRNAQPICNVQRPCHTLSDFNIPLSAFGFPLSAFRTSICNDRPTTNARANVANPAYCSEFMKRPHQRRGKSQDSSDTPTKSASGKDDAKGAAFRHQRFSRRLPAVFAVCSFLSQGQFGAHSASNLLPGTFSTVPRLAPATKTITAGQAHSITT